MLEKKELTAPCALLAPTADGAGRYPHNMKVYNLCRIKKRGWISGLKKRGKFAKNISLPDPPSSMDRWIKAHIGGYHGK